jgi:hypothetical protein
VEIVGQEAFFFSASTKKLINVQDPSDFRAFFKAYSRFDAIHQTQVHNAQTNPLAV